jgi:hypothetical protein
VRIGDHRGSEDLFDRNLRLRLALGVLVEPCVVPVLCGDLREGLDGSAVIVHSTNRPKGEERRPQKAGFHPGRAVQGGPAAHAAQLTIKTERHGCITRPYRDGEDGLAKGR